MMDVSWCRLCVSMICSELCKDATIEAGKYNLLPSYFNDYLDVIIYAFHASMNLDR